MTTENLVGEKSGHPILCRNPWFIGREKELQTLANFLTGPSESPGDKSSERLLIIQGEGGVGKTALVNEFCDRHGQFFDGVFWLHCDQDFADEIAACGETMHLPDWPDSLLEQVDRTILALKARSHALVILDNMVNFHQAAEWLERIQPRCAILTTRLRDLSQLPQAFKLELLPFNFAEASSFLEKISPEVFSTNSSVPETSQIVSLVGCQPYLLQLAGKLLRTPSVGMQPSVLQQKLAEVNHPVAEQPDSTLPVRDLSWNLPSNWTTFSILCEPIFITQGDSIKQLFCMCGYCAPNFELNDQLLAVAIRTDLSSCQELLNKLASFGLLEPSPKGLVITNQMADFGRWIGSLEQFDLLQDLMDAWDQLLCSPPGDDKILNQTSNLAHLKTVLIYAISGGIQKRGFILYFLGRYYQRKKALPLAKFFMEKAFELDREEYGFEHIKVGIILNILGNLAAQQGKPGEAAACYINALNIYKKNLGPDHLFILTVQASLEQLGSDYDW